MTTFATPSFSAPLYAASRPTWPPTTIRFLLRHHTGPQSLCLDLGCGTGLLTSYLAPHFTHVIGIDASPSMIAQARKNLSAPSSSPELSQLSQPSQISHLSSSPSSSAVDDNGASNISFHLGPAEFLDFLGDASIDMVIASQAAHWFDFSILWPMLARKVRPSGTVAFLGFAENVLSGRPQVTEVLARYCYNPPAEDMLWKWWEQPGRDILRRRYADVVPPEEDWVVLRQWVYEPGGNEGDATADETAEIQPIMRKSMTLAELAAYIRTFSAYIRWADAHPDRKPRAEGGADGDIVDDLIDEMLDSEADWRKAKDTWKVIRIDSIWGSGILIVKRK